MDVMAFQRQVETGRVPALALVHGADVQALDDVLALVSRALFPDPALASLGREVLDARETSPEAIVRSALTLPLGVSTRLVAVRHCQALGIKGSEAVREYAANPVPTSCLLLLADEPLTADRDRKSHWLLGAVPAAAVVELPVRRGRALQDWLRQRAATEGYTVTDDAARLLVQWTGDDPVILLAELRKAALAGGPDNAAVGAKEVTAVVGEHRVSGVYDLTRAVEQQDLARALVTLDRLLASEEPMLVLSMLARELRRAWTVREWTRAGVAPDQIARNLRVPPRVAEALVARARGAVGARWPRQLEQCWEVERRLKSGGAARAELTALVAELCSGA
jgi:DNA polymerase III subunit delta